MFESGQPNWLGKVWAGKQNAGVVDWWIHDSTSVCGKSWHDPMGPVSQSQGKFIWYVWCICVFHSELLRVNAGVVVNADMILLILYHLSGHSAKQVDSHKDDCWWSPGVAVWETEVRNPRVLSPDQSYRMIEDVLKKFIDEVSSFCWLILIYRMMEQYNEWFW